MPTGLGAAAFPNGQVQANQDFFTCSSWTSGTYQESVVLKLTADLSALAGKTITDCRLQIRRVGGYTAEGGTLYLKKMLRTVVLAQMTDVIYSTGNSWQTRGAQGASDVTATEVSSLTLTDTIGEFFFESSADFITLVSGWISGSVANNGFLVHPSALADYHTFSGPTGASPPVLRIGYIP